MTMKRFFLALPAVALIGCASLAPPTEVVQLKPTRSFEETVMLIGSMTNSCWSSDVNPLKDGILLRASGNVKSDQFVITGYRVTWGNGLAKNPFIIVTVTNSNGEALVSVREGYFGRGLTGIFHLNAASHIPVWLDGSRECKEFATTLWHS